MRFGSSFSPCQITGFFSVHDVAENPLRIGSTGAGINLGHGVTTSVKVKKAQQSKIEVYFNGKPLASPVVSRSVVQSHLKRISESVRVTVSHNTPLPTGCGYGTSGAGALSLSLALNEALGSHMSKVEAAQIAHEAEVKNKTGLGTVTSAFYGGFVIRTRPGAPGFARITKITPASSLRVVSGAFGPISTASVLSSEGLKERINHCGTGLVHLQTRNAEIQSFMKLSRKFAECLGMLSPRLRKAMAALQTKRILSSMMMIGESFFTIVRMDCLRETRATFRATGLRPVVSKIANRGAEVI